MLIYNTTYQVEKYRKITSDLDQRNSIYRKYKKAAIADKAVRVLNHPRGNCYFLQFASRCASVFCSLIEYERDSQQV